MKEFLTTYMAALLVSALVISELGLFLFGLIFIAEGVKGWLMIGGGVLINALLWTMANYSRRLWYI